MPLALAVALVLSAPSAKKDLADLCRFANEVVAIKPEAYPSEHGDWWNARWTKWRMMFDTSPHAPEFMTALHASSSVSPADKMTVFEGLAKSLGQPRWSCPALEKVLRPPDSDLVALCEETRRGGLEVLADFRFDSPLAAAAWKLAGQKKGAQGLAALQKASEWPDETFKDCGHLAAMLGAPAPKPVSRGPRPAPTVSLEPPPAPPPGKVELDGAVEATGGIDPKAAEEILRSHLPEMADCAGRTFAPALSVRLNAEIDAKGGVDGMGSGATMVSISELFDCIMARSRSWRFPRPSGRSATVSWVLVVK